MMRKKIVSLCMALALCLSLLPATARAVTPRIAYDTLRIGNTRITDSGYWTTDGNGNLTASDAGNYNVAFDADTNTLSLNNATIVGSYDANNNPEGTGIYVGSRSGAVSLTIQVTGNNVVSGSYGIYALSNGGEVSVTISGGGSLTASGSQNGISIVSEFSNAALAIEGTAVKASGSYSEGVWVQAGESSTGSLSVDGGSLTASGNTGIEFLFSTGMSGSGTPSLTVAGNAVVDAKSGGIAHNSSNNLSIQGNSGIVFNGSTGTVYGNASLQKDLIIGEGESLTLDHGANLDANGHNVIVDGGTLGEGLVEDLGNSVIYKVTKVELDKTSLELTEGGTAQLTATVKPDDATNKNVTWSSDDTSVATVDATGKVTAVSAGTATITVTTVDQSKTATCEVTVTAATVPVTGVTLSQNEAHLYYNRTPNTLTLTATVAPDNATNQAVTWTSSNPSVATVENGVVTAVAPGTAVITVTTQDGNHTATCTVTVRPDIPPANPNYRITVEATQGGTVTADPTAAKAGATVTLTPVPDRGYQVGTVAVTDRFGEPVAVTEQAGGTYTFTMPNGQVRVEVTFVEATPEPLPFTDVNEDDWFHDAVQYAYENGLMDGVGDGQFAPNATTNRAMVVTILYRLAGEPDESGDSAFTDVADGLWYTDAVLWAAQKGIVNGISETEFVPAGDLTREQLAAILYRYAAYQGYDVSQRADLSGFGDASSISGYAQEALSWAHAQGLVLGFEDGSLRPQGTASRAQIAAVLMRFLAAVSAE